MSILSYPQRGPHGDACWPGNCSGEIYKDLFTWTKPAVFVDPMVGSGTSIEVAREMGIEAFGLDLHSGFNILRQRIVEVVGKESDLVFSHLPYHQMHVYSGNVYGEAHPDDLSRCESDEDFCTKAAFALLNQREATQSGGYYGTLIGDWRRAGTYSSYQAHLIARMPSDELAAVIIKVQHNTRSGSKRYGRMAFPFIAHEYLLVWRKKEAALFHLLSRLAGEQQQRLTGTWRNVVKLALMQLGGRARLVDLYQRILEAAPDKVRQNPNWDASIRRTLQLCQEFTSIQRGYWQLA
jgi:hypothetical protein